MIQDAPMSGTFLSVPLLVQMAKELENISYFKIETPQAANKLRQLIAEGGKYIEKAPSMAKKELLFFLILEPVQKEL